MPSGQTGLTDLFQKRRINEFRATILVIGIAGLVLAVALFVLGRILAARDKKQIVRIIESRH